jgi:hypothetical protein
MTNVIRFADHQPAPSPDDRSTSGAPVAAAPFLLDPFEFGSWVFTVLFFCGPGLLVSAVVIGYLAFVA